MIPVPSGIQAVPGVVRVLSLPEVKTINQQSAEAQLNHVPVQILVTDPCNMIRTNEIVTTGDGYCQVFCLICNQSIREHQVTDSWVRKFQITGFFRNCVVLRKALSYATGNGIPRNFVGGGVNKFS